MCKVAVSIVEGKRISHIGKSQEQDAVWFQCTVSEGEKVQNAILGDVLNHVARTYCIIVIPVTPQKAKGIPLLDAGGDSFANHFYSFGGEIDSEVIRIAFFLQEIEEMPAATSDIQNVCVLSAGKVLSEAEFVLMKAVLILLLCKNVGLRVNGWVIGRKHLFALIHGSSIRSDVVSENDGR